MINQNYEKLMKMHLTKMAELYKNQSTNTANLKVTKNAENKFTNIGKFISA